MTGEYGISNKEYAAVAAGSLALAACLCGCIHVGYAAADAKAEAAAARAEAEARAATAALVARAPAQDEADDGEVAAVVTDMSGAQAAVSELLAGYEEQVSVSVRMLDGNGCFDVDGDEPVQSASMIKLLVLAEYLDEIDSGELSADESYTLDPQDIVGGSGSMQSDRPGTEYTLDEVAHRMIYQSDNVGTNVLIERMGVEAIQAKASELGLSGTLLAHKLMIAADDGLYNLISANDAAELLYRVANGTLASAASCARAEAFLIDQEDDEGLAQGLPDGVVFGHKTGSTDEVRHDGGIVYGEHPYVIVVLTRGLGYDEANALMAQLSAAVYDALA